MPWHLRKQQTVDGPLRPCLRTVFEGAVSPVRGQDRRRAGPVPQEEGISGQPQGMPEGIWAGRPAEGWVQVEEEGGTRDGANGSCLSCVQTPVCQK